MMKIPLLVLSHLAVLGLAYWLGHQLESSDAAGIDGSDPKSSSLHRVPHKRGGDFLQSFLPQSAEGAESRYDDLKNTLEVAGDHEKALLALISRLPDFYAPKNGLVTSKPQEYGGSSWSEIDGFKGKIIAKFEVRVLHWLRDDRDACLTFLSENLQTPGNIQNHPIMKSVFLDYAKECDFDAIAPWLVTRYPEALSSLMKHQLKSGAGMEVFDVFDTKNMNLVTHLKRQMMPHFSFSDRDEALQISLSYKSQNGHWHGRNLLRTFMNNPDHPQSEMMTWINELYDSDKLDKQMKSQLSRAVGNWLRGAESISYENRVEALEKWGNSTDDAHRVLAQQDVNSLLEEGRDWTYEFRHGRVTAEEVWQNISAQLPAMSAEGKRGALVFLFQTLAEENPEKSFVLLDGIPEKERRDIIFNSSWHFFNKIHPQGLLNYTQSLPPTENKEEEYLRIKGWEWKSRHLLRRHGDDYVEWVQQMPEGPDKTEAMRGLIWATREVNPTQAEILSTKIYSTP